MKRIISILIITVAIFILARSQDTLPNNILSQVDLTEIRYSNLNWTYARDFKFKNAIKKNQNLFFYVIPEITYDCNDDYKSGLAKLSFDYFEIKFHYLLWDEELEIVLDHFIDRTNYENDAIRIKSYELINHVQIAPNQEGLEIMISNGHSLRYNPYSSNRKIIFSIIEDEIKPILDIYTYSIWGEVSDSCEYDMKMHNRKLQFDQSQLFNGYYPIEVTEISRKNDGDIRCGDLERFNDTLNYTMYYENGAYKS